MSEIKMTCTATPHPVFEDQEFEDATQGLAADPGEGRPFMISYDLFISKDNDVYCEPDVRAWLEVDDETQVLALGALNAQLARDLAPQAFELLSWDRLRGVCADTLRKMIQGSEGETYHVCLSAHGVIIVADNMHSRAYHFGNASVISVLMPPSLSHHQTLARVAGLQRCVDAILSLEHASNLAGESSVIRVLPA